MHYRLLCLGLLIAFPHVASGQPAEEDAVRNVFLEQFMAYWRTADAEGLASLWHEEGDWMSLVGSRRIRKGRAEIEQVWSVGLRGRDTPEARMLRIEIDDVKMLRPDLAQVDLVMTFGHERTGIVREAMHAILQKGDAGWTIISSRVARISSTAAQD